MKAIYSANASKKPFPDRINVLVVDDEPPNFEFYQGIFSEEWPALAFIPKLARSLKDASQGIAKFSPDIVFLDINLGGQESGLDLIQTHDPIENNLIFVIISLHENRGITNYMTEITSLLEKYPRHITFIDRPNLEDKDFLRNRIARIKGQLQPAITIELKVIDDEIITNGILSMCDFDPITKTIKIPVHSMYLFSSSWNSEYVTIRFTTKIDSVNCHGRVGEMYRLLKEINIQPLKYFKGKYIMNRYIDVLNNDLLIQTKTKQFLVTTLGDKLEISPSQIDEINDFLKQHQ